MPHTWPSVGLLYMVLIVYSAACLGAFMLALTYKLLQFYRLELLAMRHHENDVNATSPESEGSEVNAKDGAKCHQSWEKNCRDRRRSERPVARHGLLLGIQYFLGFCLVLIFISCNVPLCVCAVLGGTLGIVINKWKRNQRGPSHVMRRQHLHSS